MLDMNNYLNNLEKLKLNNNLRKLPDIESCELIDLCSNDYLGINSNIRLREEFWNEHNMDFAFSASSSRLLSKSLDQHLQLEKLLAHTYKTEAALLFNSGYHANVGILSAVPGKNDLILADKLIHASVIDGAKLSDADFMRYKHLDYQHLENLLSKHRGKYENVFIVSESIFSMDGDLVDILSLIELKNKFNCYLYIDEAHALGVRGKNGIGCVEESDCISQVDFIVGTMGKALASFGAFVTCKNIFKDYLINYSRSFIFSTALPPINVAWSLFVFEKILSMNDKRKRLHKLSKQFATSLNIESDSHIIPFIIGSNLDTVEKSQLLKENGFNVLPIRYPTVPKNTARLRFSLNAEMNEGQLKLIQKLLLK